MHTGRGIDELSSNTHPVGGLLHTAFQHVTDTQLPANLLHVNGAAPIGKAGIAGDHKQRLETRQRGNDVLDHPIRKIFLLRIGAQVREGENCDRGFIGQRKREFRRFYRVIGDCRACGPLRLPHRPDEAETLPWQCFDEALFLAGIANRAPGYI